MARYFSCRHRISALPWISIPFPPHSGTTVAVTVPKRLLQRHSNTSWAVWRNSPAAAAHYSTEPIKKESGTETPVKGSSPDHEQEQEPPTQLTKEAAPSKSSLVRGVLWSLALAYDVFAFPIYTYKQKPWIKLAHHRAQKAKRVTNNDWISLTPRSSLSLEMQRLKIDTLEKLFDHATKKHGDRRCLGTRPVLSYEDTVGPGGVPIRKLELGDYEWKTYTELRELTERLSMNMRNMLPVRSRDLIAIFADTREEWLLTAFAGYKANLAIATIFTALSDEGVIHAATETEVSCLFTSQDLMPRLYKLLPSMPHVKNIVYMDTPGSHFTVDLDKIPKHITVQPFSLFLKTIPPFSEGPRTLNYPGPSDTAIVMYTSGSSGIPKGVEISHFNIISVIMGCADALDQIYRKCEYERYLAYLPLAHIFEFMSECKTLFHGNKIGYGSALTLTDMSPGLKAGSRGDAVVLKPTILVTVPLVLERIAKVVQARLKESGGIVPDIFDFFVRYKIWWFRKGYETPLLDKFLFSKIKSILGGEVKLLVSGGAPLAGHTQQFCRTVLCNNLVSGYGLTETAGTATACPVGDMTVGRAGAVVQGCTFRLVDWEEGGYRVTDKPFPRGEIYIGGDTVAKGYFKQPDNQDFFMDNGVQFVKTGDIAEVHDDGVIRIIDRKKDLVKLSSGEFLSLGRIESIMKISPLLENICVYANSTLPSCVAIVVPAQAEIEKMGRELGKGDTNYEALCQDPEIIERLLTELQEHGLRSFLQRVEIPRAIYVSPHVWTPQTGLVTASLKLKRAKIIIKFKQQLDDLTASIPSV